LEPEVQPGREARERQVAARFLRMSFDAARRNIARLLRVSDESKPQLYARVFTSAEVSDLNYWLEILFSIGIATLGLIINSPAVVIGAMLISPLLGPITANGLALALGDFYLGIKSAVTLVLSILVSIATAALITWLLPFHSPTGEILARVQPTLLDLGVAILSGAAGAIVVCRGGGGGGITALPGVAVAVALMPPLGVVGFGVGAGWDWAIVRGGGLLFLTNLVAIIFTSFVVFFIVRMDAPQTRQQINQWLYEHERGERLYELVERTPLRNLLGKVGSLPRRMLILLIFLVSVSLPLGRTLLELAESARVRRAVFEEFSSVLPRDNIVREDLEISAERIRVRVVALMPEGFTAERRAELEQRIAMRTGRPASVQVFDVATTEEVTRLAGRLSPEAGRREPLLLTADELRAQLMARLQSAVESAWPSAAAPIAGYAVAFRQEPEGAVVRVAYLAEENQTIGSLGSEVIRKVLRERLGAAGLELELERVRPGVVLRFAPGRDAWTAADQSALEELAAAMERYPRLRLTIVTPSPLPHGVPPERPSKSTGGPLEVRRMARVRDFFAARKIDAARVESSASAAAAAHTIELRLAPAAR
jgi:uncharacterized hydrophobic protein (TIGR00271 family)